MTAADSPSGTKSSAKVFASRVGAVVVSTRPRQWPKNLVVLAALLFALEFRHGPSVLTAVVAMLLFTLVSAGYYVLNDVVDAPLDRRHESKRKRPIAAGLVSARIAIGTGLFMVVSALALSFALGPAFGLVLSAYALVQVGYSLFLKHVVLLDVLAIAIGFVIRAAGGAVAISVAISPWLYGCTFLLALFLAVSKRWAELVRHPHAPAARPVLNQYTPDFLRTLVTMTVTATLTSYTLYTFSAPNLPVNHLMMLTVPVVLYGLFRYVYLIQVRGVGEEPERLLLEDRGILISGIVWVIASWGILQFAGGPVV